MSKRKIWLFVLLSALSCQLIQAQCPNIQIVDLRGTPGFPQTDDLNVCGRADTLSLLIFTDDPGQIAGF